jgi:hypothetical protein
MTIGVAIPRSLARRLRILRIKMISPIGLARHRTNVETALVAYSLTIGKLGRFLN